MKKILLALCLMTGTASALVHVGEGDNATLGSVTASSMTVTGAGIVIGGVLQTTAYTGGGGTTGVVSASPQYSIAAFVLPGTTTTVAGLTPGTSGYALFSGGPTAAAYFAPPATITGVTAGTGLSGGGTSGTVTLNVSNVPAATIAAGNLGASVVASSIGVSAVGVAQMNFSGSPNASTFARGDGSWASPAGGSGASSLAVFNGVTLISSPTLSVAGDGQSIIAYLIGTSSAGFKVNSASGTLQGNTFNGNSQLVQTNSSGQLPALSATNLTNIPGSQITSGIPAANIASGSLGGSVIASSITLGAMYGSPTLNAANITNIQGAQVGSGVPAANIATGSLSATVIVSSNAVNSIVPSNVSVGNYQNITGVGSPLTIGVVPYTFPSSVGVGGAFVVSASSVVSVSTTERRRTVCNVIGANNGASVLVNGDLGPQTRQYFVPGAWTLVEFEVSADSGTSNIIAGKSHAGSITNLTSSALATGALGAIACSNTGGTTGIDGATTCSSTLQNTSFAAGDWLSLVSGTADGTAHEFTACATFTVN